MVADICAVALPDHRQPDPTDDSADAAPSVASTDHLGLSPPHKDDDPKLAGDGVVKEHGKANSREYADQQADDQQGATDGKRFSTLRARLALAGWELSKTPAVDAPDVFYASRWNMARELHGLAAVATFADRVGAPS